MTPDQEQAQQMRREVQGLCVACGDAVARQRRTYWSDREIAWDHAKLVDYCYGCQHAEPVHV